MRDCGSGEREGGRPCIGRVRGKAWMAAASGDRQILVTVTAPRHAGLHHVRSEDLQAINAEFP